MKLHPRVTKAAVELVKRFEGLRRRAARLPDGSWTVGYGHTLTAREGAEVSPEDAEALLYYDLSEVATKVEAWTFAPLNQNQFEALTAFAFNIGLENFRRSTVLKRVNEGQHLQAAAAMELWRKSEVDGEGMVVDALVRRRAAEKAHYLTPPEGFRPSPTQVLKPAFDFSVIEAAAQSQAAQRAAVVDTPMEGDETSATVETPPQPWPELEPKAPLPEPLPTAPIADEPAAQIAPEPVAAPAAIAEAAPAPILYAPEADEEPAPSVEAPAHDGETLAAPPFPDASPVAPFGFRGFEPPPPRFARANDEPPAPANEAHAPSPAPFEMAEPEPVAVEASQASVAESAPAEPEHGFNLFDRPLAPPAPPVVEAALAAHAPPVHDDAAVFDPGEMAAAPDRAGVGQLRAILRDSTVLYASIGLLGVALFASSIFTMLIGHATPAHLLFGGLGVVLIIPAAIYFLLRRMGEQPTAIEPSDQPSNLPA